MEGLCGNAGQLPAKGALEFVVRLQRFTTEGDARVLDGASGGDGQEFPPIFSGWRPV
jgi:hypothetical protein